MNQVTFIVNIMPEDKLRELCDEKKLDNHHVYDKVFDYTLNLNRIHIDNFDAVLESLILEKRTELETIGIEIFDNNNVRQIPGMQWIVYGKELSLRQVKERLNDSIIVFESIKAKFGEDKPEFRKCAAVACLRSAFSSKFYSLLDSDLDSMITWYAKEHPTKSEFIKHYAHAELKDAEFYETLYRMIDSRLIDENYRTYFFNYPKNSHLYNIQQTRVRNLIVYNETLIKEIESDIAKVAFEKPEIIVSAMEKSLELVGKLPNCIIYSQELWAIAVNKFPANLTSLIFEIFSNIKEISAEQYAMIDNVIYRENSAPMFCQAILNNEAGVIYAIRNYLLDKHKRVIPNYTMLFSLASTPIDIEELKKMKGVSRACILEMIQGVVVSLEKGVIDIICEMVLKETDEEILDKAAQFYIELADVYDIEEVVNDIVDYLIMRQSLVPELEEKIYQGIKENNLEIEYYLKLVNNMPIEEIQDNQISRIVNLNRPGAISEEICNCMYIEGYVKSYLLNMILVNPNKIRLSWDAVKCVMENYGDEMWKEHPELFKKIRVWACEKFKDEMVLLRNYFETPYPLISCEEVRHMTLPETIFELYDELRADIDSGDAFVEFCNRQFRKSDVAFSIFRFIATMEEEMVPIVFYKLDMQKVRFSIMSSSKKLKIVEDMRIPLELNSSKEIVQFMDFTECLIPELENEISPDLKKSGNEMLCRAYISAIQKYGKVTKETLKNLRCMPEIYKYGDMINQEMYKRKFFKNYVCSKNMEDQKFVIEYDKLDVLWDVYIQIFKITNYYEYTRKCMRESKEFLRLVQNRNAYKDLPEDSRMAMASILQDENTLMDVLGYSDEFVIEYFSKIEGFSSKKAAETFVDIMDEHQKYAQHKIIYENVYPKLGNSQLKSKYTRLYNRANA